jgi:hypothetical protein
MITKNCTPKQHRTACPLKVAELTQTATLDVTEADTQNPLLIERGIRLLNHLVERANQEDQGESVGVGYAQFVCCVHGVESFQEVFNRPYRPSDTAYVLRLAHRITAAAGRKEFDLRLMSSVNDVSDMSTDGKNLIIVASVQNVLHFRIFDADGNMVVDTDEKSLTDKVQQIEVLKRQLKSLWPPHELTRSEKDRLITTVTSIVGHIRRQRVTKNGVKLEAGMDTFIWQSKPPHERPSKAFESTPYTEEDWKRAFPDGTRCLLNCRACKVPHGPSCPPSSGVCPL